MAGFHISITTKYGNFIDDDSFQRAIFTHGSHKCALNTECLREVVSKELNKLTIKPIIHVLRSVEDGNYFISISINANRLKKEGKLLNRISNSYFLSYILTILEDTIINNF